MLQTTRHKNIITLTHGELELHVFAGQDEIKFMRSTDTLNIYKIEKIRLTGG